MTKILLTLVIFMSFPFLASAQFDKGSILLGGQLAYSHYSTKYPQATTDASNYGSFIVSAGKAITENQVFGINLTYNPTSIDNYNNYGLVALNYKNTGYGIGVFYRKYKSLGKEFFLFGEAGAGYTGSSATGKDSTDKKLLDGSTNSGRIYLTPGIAYKISKKFFLELTIPDIFNAQYSNQKVSVPGTSYSNNTDQFSINTSLSSNPLNALGIGFRLIL